MARETRPKDYPKLKNYQPTRFMLPTSHYDKAKADRAVTFIENLCHTKGKWAGTRFWLLPWQEQLIRDIFGIVKADGNRQFRTAFVEICKKVGKSELAAAIALYLLYADNEPSAEVYGAAADRQQASIVFDVARQMVEMSPALMKRSKLMSATKRIVNYGNAGFYQVLSAEVGSKHGFSISGLVFDEIHTQPNRQLYDVLTKYSSDARQNPLHFIITTAGNDRNSIAFELHTKAIDILEGRRVDPTFYPVVYGLKDDEDWEDEANWYKVNPSLGYTVDIERLRDAYREAKQNPADEITFNSKKKDTAFSKNTYYRFLNNASFHWVKFISLLAARVTAYFDRLTRPERVTCLVLDDSVIARERSKKVELLSYVFNHVIGKTVKDFNMLTLGWTDGYSFIPVGFNMMASAKESNRIVPANASIDKRSNGGKARKNAVLQKPEAALQLIRNALNAGIKAGYVLMDTWFTNEPFIANILAEGLDVIGMLKDNKQYYIYKGKKYNLKQLGKLVSFHKPGDILFSICVKTGKQNIPVKLVFVRNRNKRSEYIVLLSTGCTLSSEEIVRTYGNRWSIELFFRTSKSLLDLGSEFQGLSYDMTVSSTAIVFTRYILIEWLRRKKNDDKTICELFYVCCDDIQDMEFRNCHEINHFSLGLIM